MCLMGRLLRLQFDFLQQAQYDVKLGMDLYKGFFGFRGELTDFIGDDFKAATLLAGAGGFNGRVKPSSCVWEDISSISEPI